MIIKTLFIGSAGVTATLLFIKVSGVNIRSVENGKR